jgi:hypothetical protein
MTMNSDIPQQGPDGIPAYAIVGLGFNVPTVGQSVTITVGPAADGSPTSTAWMFPPMTVQFNLNGTAYGVLTVTATPTNATVTLRNDGLATAGTPVPVGAGIVSGGPQGPTGATGATGAAGVSSFATLGTGGLTMPAPGSSTTVNVGSSSWTAVGNFIAVSDGTKVAVLQVTALPSGQMTLLNPIGMNINPLAGATFAAGSAVTQAAPQVGPISESQQGSTIVGNVVVDKSSILAGATLVIPIGMPALANSEVADIAASFVFWSTTTSDFGRVKQVMAVRNNGGTYQDPLGGSNAIDVSVPPQSQYVGASLASTAVQMRAQGAGLVVSITAPSAVNIIARGAIGYERGGTVVGAGPAPVITSVTVQTGGAGGGTIGKIFGSGFTGVVPGQAPGNVTLDGATASWTVANDGEIDFVSGPAAGGGVGPIIVTHPLNGPSNTNFNWTYVDDPTVMFGANLAAFGTAASIQQTSGTVTAWNDTTANARHLNVVGGVPTYNASSATFPGFASITFDGVSAALSNASFGINLGGATGGDADVLLWIVGKVISNSGVLGVMGLATTAIPACELVELSNQADCEGHSRGSGALGSPALAGAKHLFTGVSQATGASHTNSSALDNGTPGSVTGTGGSLGTAGALRLGVRASGASFCNVEIVEWGVVFLAPGSAYPSAQLTRLRNYANAKYGTP